MIRSHAPWWGAPLCLGWLCLLSACSPSLSSLQPAHVAPQGHVQATAAVEASVPTGTLSRTVDAGRTLARAAQNQMLTEAEQRQIFEAGVNFVAVPPSFAPHFALAYTVVDRLELGIRNVAGDWRGAVRYQTLRHDTGPFDMVVGLGVSYSSYEIPVDKVIPILSIDDLTRWSLDTPILIGTSRDWFRAWIGPRFLYSSLATRMRLDIPQGATEVASFNAHTTYIGGQGGLAVGYRNLFLAFELTMVQAIGSANVTVSTVSGLGSVGYSGFVVYPAFALMGEI